MEGEVLGSVLAAVGVTSAFVLAFVEFVKRQGLPDRFAPIASVVSGVLVTLFAGAAGIIELSLLQQAFAGLVAGLTAGGFYSGQKAVLGK